MKKQVFEVGQNIPDRKAFIAFLLKQGHEVDRPNSSGAVSYVNGDDVAFDMVAAEIWQTLWDDFKATTQTGTHIY